MTDFDIRSASDFAHAWSRADRMGRTRLSEWLVFLPTNKFAQMRDSRVGTITIVELPDGSVVMLDRPRDRMQPDVVTFETFSAAWADAMQRMS